MKSIAVLLVGLLMIAACMSGGSITHFMNVPSFLVTFLGGHLMLASVYGVDAIAVLKPGYGETNPDRGRRIAAAGSKFYILAGWVGVLIGVIQIGNADIQDLTALGAATAILILCPFYAYLMVLMFWTPLGLKMDEKLAETQAG